MTGCGAGGRVRRRPPASAHSSVLNVGIRAATIAAGRPLAAAGQRRGGARGRARRPAAGTARHPLHQAEHVLRRGPGRASAAADIQGPDVSLLPNPVMLVRIGTVDLGRMKVSNPADQPGRRCRDSSRVGLPKLPFSWALDRRRRAMPGQTETDDFAGFLGGIRVLEIGDELGEYCGKVLAGLGADVVRVEPPGGEATRRYGPFYHDEPDPDRSLYFWHYNLGKRSVVLDLDAAEGRRAFAPAGRDGRRGARHPAARLPGRARDRVRQRLGGQSRADLGADHARSATPGRGPITPASDLIHLALGGDHDELRLRSRPGRLLRDPAGRAADVAVLPHRRRDDRRWPSWAR